MSVEETRARSMFADIIEFHARFGLPPSSAPNRALEHDLQVMRLNFMLEELREYAHACGYELQEMGFTSEGTPRFGFVHGAENYAPVLAFDGLIDLAYVTLGTAFLHRFPFDEGWDRVHAANMRKVRSAGDGDPLSKRGSRFDVVKPPGWLPPKLDDLLDG